jgi:hypothetical protein
MLIKNESSSNETPPLSDPQNDFKLSYESIEKTEILNKYFCSISNIKDENKNIVESGIKHHQTNKQAKNLHT